MDADEFCRQVDEIYFLVKRQKVTILDDALNMTWHDCQRFRFHFRFVRHFEEPETCPEWENILFSSEEFFPVT